MHMTPEQGLAEFERHAAAMIDVIAAADPAALVSGCPGWTLADLVTHIGGIHQWAQHAIVHGNADGEPTEPGATDPDTLVRWYAESARDLVDVLRRTAPEAPAWTFGPQQTATFWFRRQAHEIAVHLWDARASQGIEGGIEPGIAADGIEEVVTMFFPRQVRLGRTPPLPRALALVTDDGRWVLAGDGTQLAPEAATTVSGPTDAVLLLLWNRIGLDDDRLSLAGDEQVAHAVLQAGIVP